jgi:hypothetical protein
MRILVDKSPRLDHPTLGFGLGRLGSLGRVGMGGGVIMPSLPVGAIAHWKSGIVVTGSGVSQWDDETGNGHHWVQTTDANRPAKQGDDALLFNGSSHKMVTGAWTQAQPLSIYMLVKQITFTNGDKFFDLNDGQCAIYQRTTTPDISLYAGSADAAHNSNLTLDTYKAVCAVFNGASSLIHVNGIAATTGNPGTNGINGVSPTLGAWYASTFNGAHCNMELREMAIYPAAHDATKRQAVFDYLEPP